MATRKIDPLGSMEDLFDYATGGIFDGPEETPAVTPTLPKETKTDGNESDDYKRGRTDTLSELQRSFNTAPKKARKTAGSEKPNDSTDNDEPAGEPEKK